MNPFLRFFIALTIAWLLGLLLVVGSMIRQRRVIDILREPESESSLRWPERIAYEVGFSTTRTAIGLVMVTVVAAIVLSFLPPPPTVANNTARIKVLETWKMEHDSLHKRGIP